MLLALVLLAQANAQPVPPPAPSQKVSTRAPLSPEDRELVKQLALLERVELLRNLELFDDSPRPAPRGR